MDPATILAQYGAVGVLAIAAMWYAKKADARLQIVTDQYIAQLQSAAKQQATTQQGMAESVQALAETLLANTNALARLRDDFERHEQRTERDGEKMVREWESRRAQG